MISQAVRRSSFDRFDIDVKIAPISIPRIGQLLAVWRERRTAFNAGISGKPENAQIARGVKTPKEKSRMNVAASAPKAKTMLYRAHRIIRPNKCRPALFSLADATGAG